MLGVVNLPRFYATSTGVCRIKTNSLPKRAIANFFLIPHSIQALAKLLHGKISFVVLLAPLPETSEKDAGLCLKTRVEMARIIQKPLYQVLLAPIGFCRFFDGLWWLQSSTVLPLQAATHSPGQDAREFSAELVVKVQVAILLGDGHSERYPMNTAPHGYVLTGDFGEMIAGIK